MLTVLGEAIVDLVGEGDRRYRAHPGGSPLNVAVGLGRLGQPVSLAERGALGRGPGGERLGTVDLGAVLDRACLVAALTCARAGADPPTRAEVEAAERDLA